MHETDALHRFRAAEMDAVRSWFPAGARVLELGGGDGYQARLLADMGLDVSSIDVAPQSGETTYFPVKAYDGVRLPTPDGSVDVVFSSNVLEHIPHLTQTLDEIRRVLRPGGSAVHLVPSASWRLWTTLAHFPWLATYPFREHEARSHTSPSWGRSVYRNGPARLAMKALGLAAHGEYPSALSELYYFRRARWERFMIASGFEIVHSGSSRLFYTGYTLLAELGIPARRRLSQVLGGSCHVLVTRPTR